VVGSEPVRGPVVDESLVQQPLDGSPLGSNITKRVPHRNQPGVVLIDLVLESSERSAPLERQRQMSGGVSVADALSEVSHVLVPNMGGERVDENEIQLVDLDGVLSVDARVAGPERHLARTRVDQPTVLVVGLIRERGCDPLNVDSTQVEHPLRVEREPGAWKDRVNGVVTPSTSQSAPSGAPVPG
jgi:hypothetical protein